MDMNSEFPIRSCCTSFTNDPHEEYCEIWAGSVVRDCCPTHDDENHLPSCSRMVALNESFAKDAFRRNQSPTASMMRKHVLAASNGNSITKALVLPKELL